MKKPNDILSLQHDTKKNDKVKFWCWDLLRLIMEEADKKKLKKGTPEYVKHYLTRLESAKFGNCFYRNKCKRFEKTSKKHSNNKQLNLEL